MSNVLYEQQGHIGIITMNRPDALNALNSQTLNDLDAVISAIAIDTVRCVIVTGAGERAFVAGADVKEMSGYTPAEALEFSRRGNAVFRRLEKLPIPVIAAVNGFALGGGCELAMACDIIIAADTASFAQPEAGLGINPGFGGTQRLARLVGVQKAKELLYTCRRVKAPEALEIGLAAVVVPAAELKDKALEMAGSIAANAPCAVRACKQTVSEGLQMDIDAGLELEAQVFSRCFESEDRREAMTAFVEKRKPEPFRNK